MRSLRIEVDGLLVRAELSDEVGRTVRRRVGKLSRIERDTGA